MQIDLQIEDLATPRLRAILHGLAPEQRRALLGRLGKALEVRLKDYFATRNAASPNRRGWPRQHWWAREVRAKTALRDYDAEQATVGIASRQFAFRRRGGTIKPGPGKKFLAIPTRAEAYGVRPSANTLPGLFFVRVRGRAFLARREGGARGALRVYWRLVSRVTQQADPHALPPLAELREELVERARAELARLVEQYPAPGAGGGQG